MIEIVVDRTTLEGTVNLVGENAVAASVEAGSRILAARQPRPDLAPDPSLPDDTRIWAALQDVSGGTWGGAVYDAAEILRVVAAGKKALRDASKPRRHEDAKSVKTP
jgi:hypothetical protein